MSPADGARSLAGYALGARQRVDVFGEVFAATGEGGRAVELMVVTPELAGERAFVERLTRQAAPRLHRFGHPALVGTVLVAREGRELVVVTEPVRAPRSLAELIAAAHAAGGGLPPAVIAAVAGAVIDGLAAAHAAGVVHGAVHPRSVLVDRDGLVRLADLAVGFAAMSAVAAGSERVSLQGMTGFVPPEVVLGDPPSPAADVYAVGALVCTMITGEPPAGTLTTTPAMARLVQRALDTELTRRFASAIELQEDFAEALEDDRWPRATAAELAALCAALDAPAAGGDAIDAATEDLLASLDGVVEVSRPGGGDGSAPSVAVAGRRLRTTNALDAILFDLDEDGGSAGAESARATVTTGATATLTPPTPAPSVSTTAAAPTVPAVPSTSAPVASAPVASAPPPPLELPAPPVEAPTPPARPAAPAPTPPARAAAPPVSARATPLPSRSPTPPPVRTAARAATPPPVADGATEHAVPRRAATAAPELGGRTAPRRSWTWLWVLILVAGGAGLTFALLRQKGELTQAQRAARDRKAAAKAAQEDLDRRLREARPDPGALRVTSRPDNAGVWLLLGRAPFESLSLATDGPWELRVELEGYQARDVRVSGAMWQGPETERKASLDVTLTPGALDKPLPGVPPSPPADVVGVPGAGRLSVKSDPPGAAVWLLVGVTDSMNLAGIEAGRDYELKVTHDGFLPGFVRFAAEDWRDGGDPAVPLAAAPKKAVLERSVELVAAPRGGGRGR